MDQSEWEEYRFLSLSPAGFGDRRVEIWSKVLHARPQKSAETSSEADANTSFHPDERQIRLDTERSFVLYPVDSKTDKDRLQSDLHDLLVEIFRRRPKLNYFQGYHDIITVLLLTLPPELQLPCAEQLSLQRVRDSMGSTLEPVLGLLRVMKNLIRAADPQYSDLLEQTSPLPYYALPNLLTLFSHDMPTLPLIQHVFDYLLCRPPIFTVYLATAIILSRKQDVERLEEEGEEGMLHSLLSALPELVDDDSEILKEGTPLEEKALKEEPQSEKAPEEETPLEEKALQEETALDTEVSIPDIEAELTGGLPKVLISEVSIPDGKQELEDSPETANDITVDRDDSPSTEPDPTPAEPQCEPKTEALPDASDEPEDTPLPLIPNRRKPAKSKSKSLTALLALSDALHRAHPPTDPSLNLSSIMGPQSVIFTWSPRRSDMPSADEAERMVQRLDLIVYPEPPPAQPDKEKKGPAPKRRVRRAAPGSAGLLLGAGIVLGVAVAVSVYGARQGGDPARELRKMGHWVGGLLAGASERIVRYTK